jgi:hypothetical protein
MSKNGIPTPAAIANLRRKGPDPDFKPRPDGSILRIGSITPFVPPANKPTRQGARRSLYRNK